MSASENSTTNEDLSSTPQNVRIKLSSYSSKPLDKAVSELITTSKRIGAIVVGAIPLPDRLVSYSCSNRAPSRNTKSKDRLMIKKHRRLLILLDANSKMIDELSNITIAPGVGVDIQIEIVNKAGN